MRKRTRDSTYKTIELIRAADKVMDSIGSPPSIWNRVIRTVKRELLYGFLTTWQGPAVALIWLGIAMMLFAIVF